MSIQATRQDVVLFHTRFSLGLSAADSEGVRGFSRTPFDSTFHFRETLKLDKFVKFQILYPSQHST